MAAPSSSAIRRTSRRSARPSWAIWPVSVSETEFTKRGAKVISISVDPAESHHKWKADIQIATGQSVEYPMIADKDLNVAKQDDMLPADTPGTAEARTPPDNATVRSVFITGRDKRVKLSRTYPKTTAGT
jgi:alkyl hydroperoxide reductase subunit AhpC